jgi:hypothetical protein
MTIQITNLQSPRSNNPVPNQFLISTDKYNIFKSYQTIIAKQNRNTNKITLDKNSWDYSATTLKYLKVFLGTNKSKKELEKDIKEGIYKLSNLN